MSRLPETAVSIVVSDPWELADEAGADPLTARVVRFDDEALLLRLDSPTDLRGELREFFVAQPRHEGFSIQDLFQGRELHCNLTAISNEQAHAPDPFDLGGWRGGLGLIATLERR
jgi:hypothetical protein